MDDDIILIQVTSIRDLRIGDEICTKPSMFPFYVVGIFAESGTLGFQPADYTGIIYGDFPDNPSDVFEFDLSKEEIYKIIRSYDLVNVEKNDLLN